MSNSLNTPVEALEHQLPIRIRRYGIRRGSGGRGRHDGGQGVVKEFEFLGDADIAVLSERRIGAPYGRNGGAPGERGRNFLNGAPIPGKGRFRVAEGDRLRIETPGGGGYGKPDS